MALSNKFGWLVVATGNKSELSVGYATLYGDMAGGFALLKDVFKTDVFRLSRHLNERAGRELISVDEHRGGPRRSSCGADQLDEDLLPPYPVLDAVLEAYVELDLLPRRALSRLGFDPDVVDRTGDDGRPGRGQAPPGAARRQAAGRRAFGRDRRVPITYRGRGWKRRGYASGNRLHDSHERGGTHGVDRAHRVASHGRSAVSSCSSIWLARGGMQQLESPGRESGRR